VAERAPLPLSARLSVDYLSDTELAGRTPGWWSGVLGVVPFGAAPDVDFDPDIPIAPVPLRVLGGGPTVSEVWRLEEPLRSGRLGLVHFRAGEAALFGRIVIPEPSRDGANGEAAALLQQTTVDAYQEMFTALERLRYPHLLRIWNYLSAINEETELGERYRQFNTARRRAFLDSGRRVEGDVPAACALGSQSGSPLVIYFIATRTRSRAVENPRQVSAYHYPREHGPDRPIFSRAAIASDGVGEQLFISGTASIVGHRSIHVGDAAAQARETVANVNALIAAANLTAGGGIYAPEALKYKVYVRHDRDLPAIRAELNAGLHAGHPITYLQADICRSELLVEIEAVGGPARVARSTRS